MPHPITVLVTGATGLLGSHLLVRLVHDESLKKQPDRNTIVGLKRPSSDLGPVREVFSYYPNIDNSLFEEIEWRTADMLDEEPLKNALKDVDQIYHCAATVSFDPKDRNQLINNNITATNNLLNSIIKDVTPLVLHVSSTSALGDPPKNKPASPVNESTPRDPNRQRSGYSISKYESEKTVQQAIDEGLNGIIVNPGIILGPGFWNKGSSMLFTTVQQGLRFYTKGGTGYVDVRDLVDAMIKLMAQHRQQPAPVQSGGIENRFCLVGFNMRYKQFFDAVADALNRPRPSIKAGKLLSAIAWRLDTLRARIKGSYPLITKETAKSANRHQFFSSEKVKQQLGDNFTFTPPGETIKWISNYYPTPKHLVPTKAVCDTHPAIPTRITTFLNHHHVATVATVATNTKHPWIAHCFYTFIEKEQIIVFTTDDDTRHGKEMLGNQQVAIGISLETKEIGKIRGVQIEGTAIRLDKSTNNNSKQLYQTAKRAYLKRFPYAVLMKTTLWAVQPETIKLTDNRLGFGKKVYWEKGGW